MPWRGPKFEGELPSLGWLLLEWWAEFLPSPRDPAEPLIFTDEQAQLLVDWYTIDPRSGRFLYRRGISRRAKGWGKSPVEAAKCIAELAGPVLFDGWDASGEPVGRPWGTGNAPNAWVQIAAVSEDQTDNTHSVVHEFLTANDGRAAQELNIDAGLTRSFLRDGNRKGRLEPVTASAGSREGQPITHATMDETHLWTPRNGGVRLARTLRRNVAKMGGRSYETTNSFEPGEGTVAEASHKDAEAGAAGIFYDAVEAPRIDLDNATDPEVKAALAVAYGQAWWVDLDRLVVEARDPSMPREDVERFFFNWNTKGGGKAVDAKRWAELAVVESSPQPGTYIGLGFDGSISNDATILRGCTREGRSFAIGEWLRPAGVKDWRVPRQQVHEKLAWAMDRWRVGRMYADPPKWWSELDLWASTYRGPDDTDIVIAFDTNRDALMGPAVDRWLTAIREGTHTHDDDPTCTEHVLAARLRKTKVKADESDPRTLYTLTKDEDGRKIDAAVADVLAHEAALTMPDPVDLPEREFFGAWA